MAAVLTILAWYQSPEVDEQVHVAAGISYWQTGDARMNYEHPPMVKLLGGVGAVVAGASPNYASESWEFGTEWEFAAGLYRDAPPRQLHGLVFLPRIPLILLTLCLGLVIYLCGQEIGGPTGGLLALFMYASYPLFLGYGPFVMNDIAVSLFVVLTCWATGAFWRRPTWWRAVWLGSALGGALLAKFSAILLIPVLALVFAVLGWRQRHNLRRDFAKRVAVRALFALFVGFAFVYITYAFTYRNMVPHQLMEVWRKRTTVYGTTRNVGQALRIERAMAAHPKLERVVAPVFFYAAGISNIRRQIAARPAWLLGTEHPRGWGSWFYYPAVMLFKSPSGFLVLIAFGIASLSLHRGNALRNPTVVSLVVFFVVYTATVMRGGMYIGLRHFAPAIVCMILFSSLSVPWIRQLPSKLSKVAVGLCLGAVLQMAVTAVAAWPFYIPYFNFLRGQHPRAWVASSSNVDQGTYLPWVQAILRDKQKGSVAMAWPRYPVPLAGERWVPEANQWPCSAGQAPASWVVISAIRRDSGQDNDCEWLNKYPREEVAGGSMWLYDVRPMTSAPGAIGSVATHH
jgi:4-amino-4-deoxy-L-arabinose transferase-like glycosyltransferase